MADTLTKKQRSFCMSRIKSKNTSHEELLKKYLRGSGFKFQPRIKGSPDFINQKEKIALFLDGCFWHSCPKCYKAPKSNKKYWRDKIRSNIARDKKNNLALKEKGYKIIRVWSHELKNEIPNKIKKLRKTK